MWGNDRSEAWFNKNGPILVGELVIIPVINPAPKMQDCHVLEGVMGS